MLLEPHKHLFKDVLSIALINFLQMKPHVEKESEKYFWKIFEKFFLPWRFSLQSLVSDCSCTSFVQTFVYNFHLLGEIQTFYCISRKTSIYMDIGIT